jgi:hypothetical protein
MVAQRVKKVTAYPISATLTGPSGAIKGNIVKLTKVGFLIETEKSLTVSGQFTVSFELPVSLETVTCVGVVVKVYSRYGGEPGKLKSHALNEIHFKSLSGEQSQRIHQFLVKIKQV